MKREATFHLSIFCIAVLTFTMPFAALAQQNSVRVAAETAAAQDANAIRFDAKVAAEQDANHDTNKLLWFGAGVGTLATGSLCGIVGCLVGNFIVPPKPTSEPRLDFMPLLDLDSGGGAVTGGCIGCAAGVLLPLNGVYRYQPDPPPERLLGKSPEYVEFYTGAYKAKTRVLRTKWAAAGAATSVLLLLGSVPLY